jgi:hypothetical protein
MLGGNNNINVLDRSPLIGNLLRGDDNNMRFEVDRSPLFGNLLRGDDNNMRFKVNGNVYHRYYLLTDGIYPRCSCFVQPLRPPQGEKKEHFSKMQAALRKDVERAFGVLQARWEIVKNPVRQWDLDTISNIMYCCIILHNMIVQDAGLSSGR